LLAGWQGSGNKFIVLLFVCLELLNNCLTKTLACILFIKREEFLAARKRRSDQLDTMLNDAKQQWEDHASGRRLLEPVEARKLQHKIEIFQRKLETMQGDMDERDVARILSREKLRDERLAERRKQYEDNEL
jgi:hypothetical protein